MVCVLPGVTEVLASFFELVSMLIKDDLPTLDLPMKANSGLSGGGHLLTSEKLLIKFAEVIFIC